MRALTYLGISDPSFCALTSAGGPCPECDDDNVRTPQRTDEFVPGNPLHPEASSCLASGYPVIPPLPSPARIINYLCRRNICAPYFRRFAIIMSLITNVSFSVEPINHGPTDRLRRTHDRRPSDPDVQQSGASCPSWSGDTER